MKTQHPALTAALVIALAMCLGSNCIQRSTVTEPVDLTVPGTVTIRNIADQAVHLILLTERVGDANLVQPGQARVVDVDLRDAVLDVVAFEPGNPGVIGGIRCTISEEVNGALAPTGVEIVWNAVGPTGFECRTGG